MSENPVKNIRWEGKTAIVEATGEIDLHRSSAFQKELTKVLDRSPSQIVVDLSDVPYMDSSGVASLVKLLSSSRKVGVRLKLLSPTAKVRGVFEITRLDSVFTIFDDEKEAIAEE